MIIAVTGGTGFIGKKLVSKLVSQGNIVKLLTRSSHHAHVLPPSVEVINCDLVHADVSQLVRILEGVDVLYHCAGQISNASEMHALHVDATIKLVQAATNRVNHWVQLSSVGVYGPVLCGEITEDSPFNPVGQYEITKAKSDKIVLDAVHKGGFSCSILRPSNVFGGEMTNQSLFSMVAMIDRGFFFFIGKPGVSANYIHVDNVVEALIRCGTLPSAKNETYNLSDCCTLENFVEIAAAALGRSPPKLRIPQSVTNLISATLGRLPSFPLTQSRVNALINRSTYPVLKIKNELGYVNVISIDDGIRELISSYLQNRLK